MFVGTFLEQTILICIQSLFLLMIIFFLSIGVPFGLVISPMAKVSKDEIEPPVTDFGPIGPIRCIRCKAYMCSLMQFIDGGNFHQIVLKDLPF